MQRKRLAGSPRLTWEEFTEAFMMRFLLASTRTQLATEFEKLMQTQGMTITEYDIKFTQLSHHAMHLVENEHMRAVRFISGLADPYFIALSP